VPSDAIERRRLIARDLTGWQIEGGGGEDVLVREQRLAS
jgi:hypothetical protein